MDIKGTIKCKDLINKSGDLLLRKRKLRFRRAPGFDVFYGHRHCERSEAIREK